MKLSASSLILAAALVTLPAGAQPTNWLGETPTITGKVEGFTGGADIGIVMGFGEEVVFESDERIERIGRIAADGTFTMILPTPSRAAPFWGCEGKQVSNQAAKVSLAMLYPIAAATSRPTRNGAPAAIHGLIYSDADTSVTGTCKRSITSWASTSPGDPVQTTYTYSSQTGDFIQTSYNLTLRRGWNWISYIFVQGQPQPRFIVNVTSPMEWYVWLPRR